MNADTTIQTRSPLVSQPTEIQVAQNTFAIAVKNHIANPNLETLKAMTDAQEDLYRLQDLYREGRKLRLQFAQGQMHRQSGRRA
jgi:hypothetical protein